MSRVSLLLYNTKAKLGWNAMTMITLGYKCILSVIYLISLLLQAKDICICVNQTIKTHGSELRGQAK